MCVVTIIRLDRPELLAANAWLNGDLNSIYFSKDRKEGYIPAPKLARIGDKVRITEGPHKDIGKGVVKSL